MEIEFTITHPGEQAAGINAYSDTITISVESGDPGGEDGEFVEHLRESLAEWFDGAAVDAVQEEPCEACDETRDKYGFEFCPECGMVFDSPRCRKK